MTTPTFATIFFFSLLVGMEAHGIVALVCISLMVSEAGYLFKYIFVHLHVLSYSIQDCYFPPFF